MILPELIGGDLIVFVTSSWISSVIPAAQNEMQSTPVRHFRGEYNDRDWKRMSTFHTSI